MSLYIFDALTRNLHFDVQINPIYIFTATAILFICNKKLAIEVNEVSELLSSTVVNYFKDVKNSYIEHKIKSLNRSIDIEKENIQNLNEGIKIQSKIANKAMEEYLKTILEAREKNLLGYQSCFKKFISDLQIWKDNCQNQEMNYTTAIDKNCILTFQDTYDYIKLGCV
jgi:hypothetical protein